MRRRRWLHAAVILLLLASVLLAGTAHVGAAEPKRDGVASHYGPGTGVATQWCTWTLRHTSGCGLLAIQSHQTGLVAIAPVVDWCQCHRGTADERIVDLQWGVVAALGLDPADGLYDVTTWPVGQSISIHSSSIPDTAMAVTP